MRLIPTIPAAPARRRSDRVSITFPVEITGTDEAGEVFCEKTCTTSVSRYGCGVKLPRAVGFNEELRVRRLDNGNWETGRVVGRMGAPSNQPLCGIEIVHVCDDFWGIRFSSSDERLTEALRDGIYFVDRERKITHWSESAESISGHLAADMVGTYCYNNVLGHIDQAGKSLCAEGCPLASVMLDGKPREIQVGMTHKEGHPVVVSVRAQAIFNSGGSIVGAIEMFHTDAADGPDTTFVRAGPGCGPKPERTAAVQIVH